MDILKPLKLDADRNYVINIPVDEYQPGYCQWKVGGLPIKIRLTALPKAKPVDVVDMYNFEPSAQLKGKSSIIFECSSKDDKGATNASCDWHYGKEGEYFGPNTSPKEYHFDFKLVNFIKRKIT